jgi:hypothetical protein
VIDGIPGTKQAKPRAEPALWVAAK